MNSEDIIQNNSLLISDQQKNEMENYISNIMKINKIGYNSTEKTICDLNQTNGVISERKEKKRKKRENRIYELNHYNIHKQKTVKSLWKTSYKLIDEIASACSGIFIGFRSNIVYLVIKLMLMLVLCTMFTIGLLIVKILEFLLLAIL